MKKLYLVLTTVAALLITTIAAGQCPSGIAYPFKYSTNCYVYVYGTLSNADINVYSGVTRINTTEGQTDTTGAGVVFFTCSQTITRILMTRPDGTVCDISGARIATLATLPVKISSFRAQLSASGTASLEWSSAFELQSEKYLVQRSLDGRTYTTIGEVAAAGNSMQTINYSFDDAQLGDRAAYYRLQMKDIDGKVDYSRSIYVNNKRSLPGSGSFKIFPNPFRAEVQLVGISAADVNRKSIRVYNAAGKEIGFSVTGANAITIDASAPRGVYMLRVDGKTFKLIKE